MRACSWPSAGGDLALTRHTGPLQSRLRTTDCISLSKSAHCCQFWLMARSVLWFLSWQKIKSSERASVNSESTGSCGWVAVCSAASAGGSFNSSEDLCSLGFSVSCLFITSVSLLYHQLAKAKWLNAVYFHSHHH